MQGVHSVLKNEKLVLLIGIMLEIANEMLPRKISTIHLESLKKAFMTPSKFTPN